MKQIHIILFLLLPLGLFSQVRKTDQRIIEEEWRYSREKKFNTWSLSVGYGAFWMYADVSDFSFVPKFKDIKFTPSVILAKQLYPALSLDLQYIYGDMVGKSKVLDMRIPESTRTSKDLRDIYYDGDFHEFSFSGAFFINQMIANPGPVKDKWDFYLKVGAGISLFRSRLHFSDTDEVVRIGDLNPGEGSQYLMNGYDRLDPQKKIGRKLEVIYIPATHVGVMYKINNKLDLSWETTLRFPLSDHFDNILTGNSNDRPFYSGIFLSYKFGKKDTRHLRWTYGGLGMNIFGRAKRNPLIDQVSLLEDEIERFEAAKEPKIHIVEITEHETQIYQPLFIRTLYFPKDGNKKIIDTNIIKDKDEELVFLAEVIIQMKYNPDAILKIYGYIDENDPGDHEELSSKECEWIVDFLVNSFGGDKNRMEIIPLGSSSPLATGEEVTDQLREKTHRRVDMILELQ